jgi:hypothetical protein
LFDSLGSANRHHVGSQLLETGCVAREISLKGEHADAKIL